MPLPKNPAASLGSPYGNLIENTDSSRDLTPSSNLSIYELFDVEFDPTALDDGTTLEWDASSNKFNIRPGASFTPLSGVASTTVASAPATVSVAGSTGTVTLPASADNAGLSVVVAVYPAGTTGAVVLAASGESISGTSTSTGAALTFIADGVTGWISV